MPWKQADSWQRQAGGGNISGMLSAEDETRAVTEVSHRLAASFPEVAPDVVEQVVHASHQQFAGSPIRDFVPVLVERYAKSSLTTQSYRSWVGLDG